MTIRHFPAPIFLMLLIAAALAAQGRSTAITSDPPQDKTAPATFQTFQLPSHGSLLNAFVYVAAGAAPHPMVILLHGFPGNERNLDLAQALRRAGDDVLFFDYRGSWGSPGDFSFTHSIEDTQAAIAYVSDPVNAARLRADPARVILVGHSMGGFMARYAAGRDPNIVATVLISASALGVDRVAPLKPEQRAMALVPLAEHFKAEGMAPLAGCTAASLAAEVIAHADAWNIPSLARDFPARPLLVVHSDDADTRLQPVHGRTSCLARFSERSFKSAEAVRGF
jgi:pimeloyl-ACP methyl ester carboxylesterase